ncbi:MAG TPA: energy transducer TonB [Polyangia bacterium]
MTVTTERRPARPHVRLVRPASCAPGRPGIAGTGRARRERRREVRRARRGRAAPLGAGTAAAVHAALSAAGRGHDGRWAGVLVWALALAAHVVVAAAVWRTPAAGPVARASTRITVQVQEVPPAPAPSSTVAAPAAVPPRRSAPRVAHVQMPRAERAPAPAAPAAPVKVVGLSLESTSEAGEGPAFAVGDTLAGTTAAAAALHRPATGEPPAGPNRVARGVPRPGSVLTPPRRLHEVKPHYPDARRAAGVEADVLLVVSLDDDGRVLSVTVGRGSGDAAFDESARAAAREERFSPALRDGVPVPTTFTFTTHFRLDTP